MKQFYLLFLLVVRLTAQGQHVNRNSELEIEYPSITESGYNATDSSNDLLQPRFYIHAGIGISKMEEYGAKWFNQKLPNRLLQYNLGAGMEIPMFSGLSMDLELEYSHVFPFKAAGGHYQSVQEVVKYGPEEPCSTCVGGVWRREERLPTLAQPRPYYQEFEGEFGILRVSAGLSYHKSLPWFEGVSFYVGAAITFNSRIHFKGNWRNNFAEEQVVESRAPIKDNMNGSNPFKIGIDLKSRLRIEARYIEDIITEFNPAILIRRTVILSGGYTF